MYHKPNSAILGFTWYQALQIRYTKSKHDTVAAIIDGVDDAIHSDMILTLQFNLENNYLKVSSEKHVSTTHSCTNNATQASTNSNFHLLVVFDIDDRLLPFASRDTTLEQNVDLTERPVLHLWNPDPSHDSTDQGGASPDVTALAAQVPFISVEHVAGKEDARNIDQVVGTSSDTGGQWPETNG